MSDFPGVKNTKSGIESVWIYHGIATTMEQAASWRLIEKLGHCPWCARYVSNKYGNMKKHLRACPQKPNKAEAHNG